MRKIIYSVFLVAVCAVGYAQQGFQEQINELKQKSDKFNVYLNFQGSLDAVTKEDIPTQTTFKARQLRLEFRGNINEKIFYRLRHRLNRSSENASLDNLSKATDMMYAGFKVDDQWTITAGKMCQAWGGFEFDLNPINIYEYSDFIDNMDNFSLGGMVTYTPNKNHEFNLQVTNASNKIFEDMYGKNVGKPHNTPLTYLVNWNGNLLEGKLQTRWAVGIQNESANHTNAMYMFGTRLNLPKVQIYLDYMRADEELDRLRYTPESASKTLENTKYNSFVAKADYQPSEKINLFAKGMYETAESAIPQNKRTSLGYFAGVEYLPYKDQDLRFFLAYIGRKYIYEKTILDTYTNRVSLGLIYRIKAF